MNTKIPKFPEIKTICNKCKFQTDVTINNYRDILLSSTKTYINRKNCNGRTLFPPIFWSDYKSVANNLPRTTNLIESWHRRCRKFAYIDN